MAVRFSDEQVIKATGGHRLRVGSRASYDTVCTDTRSLQRGCLFVCLVGETHDAHQFLAQAAAQGASGAVVQKGRTLPIVPNDFALFEVEDTLHALGALARFHRFRFKLPIGAVTGSNGKTTTKEMIAAILETRGPALKTQGNLNNEIGVPLTLFALEPGQVAAIVEMGMNHAGEIARMTEMVQPDAGLITIVQPAHLKGLGSIEGVAAAKGELFHGLKKGAIAVVNLDDARVVDQAKKSGAATMTFGRHGTAEVRLVDAKPLGHTGLQLSLEVKGQRHQVKLGFLGEHNALNAAGAFALCLALGYTPEECVRGLEAARPHARRLNWVEAPGGIAVLDDCYNANPASMAAALKTLSALAKDGRAVAVLGDMLELGADELAEHQQLGEQARSQASLVAFFGPRSEAGYLAAKGTLGVRAAHFLEMEPLLAWLRPQLQQKDVVLVKGSRGMRLERVVQALTGAAAGGPH